MSHVSSASYPIAQPLATLLNVAISNEVGISLENEDEHSTESKVLPPMEIEVESKSEALQHFIQNCFLAIDDVLFSTPSSQRQRQSFQHRQLIRISTDETNNTLTITDLGSGMTRSDLINSLGVGSRLSSHALHTARAVEKHIHGQNEDKTGINDNGDDSSLSGNDSVSSTSSEESQDGPANDIAEMDINHEKNNEKSNIIKIPCRAKDVGSFYSALCALGLEVEIGTKSKFDDYYVFKLPSDSKSVTGIGTLKHNRFSHFSISRPMHEGVKPTIENGFEKLTDIRGDSGTRVTITLNESAVQAGFLKEEEVLKPMLEKFLEASPYSVVLDKCCTEEQRKEIIDASRREKDDFEQMQQNAESDDEEFEDVSDISGKGVDDSHNSVKERAKYIPLRLSMGERKMLRLVEASMDCCDYTTEVDKPFKSSTRRTHAQLKGITSVLRGMVTACDYSAGQKLMDEDNYSDYEKFFCQMFEIARRHKIMNPEKMRTEYGKLIYLLQDAVSPSIMPHLNFSCKGQIETVYKFLEDRGGLDLLKDPLIEIATKEVLAEKKSRTQISHEIRRKERAVAHLKQTYHNRNLSSEDVHLCLYSICDNDSFLNSNRVPIDKVIVYLQKFFSSSEIEEGYSLSIVDGQDGARLSHSHERQYYFALQSLTLWRDIIDDMFRLWAMAEEDLLSESVSYVLQDTGQGYQRVQQSPQTYRSMQRILSRVQAKVNQWVGSNVIHLGDHNVPNSLTFIDKYTQVPRILSPIVTCLENLERICEEDDAILKFVEDGFGGVEQLKKDILYDFFKSAFDGSGADNFYDAGSCIDGRLTSAWNWCSQLQNKPFYCIFKLTGFTGFDGEFK